MAEEKEKIEIEVIPRIPKDPVGWLEVELPKTTMMRLQHYIEVAKKNPVNYNDHLAGNITKSLLIEDKDNWFFHTILSSLIDKFVECYPSYTKEFGILTENVLCYLDKFWVNFQKENEFNPFHHHSGIFSFVVFMKIPTDWREQHALPFSANSNEPCASNFEFQYTTMLGNFPRPSYKLDKKSEGMMLFFPAKLQHAVYPFYNCDRERVSISGNINFDIIKE